MSDSIALRKAKIAYNFGLSECNMVKNANLGLNNHNPPSAEKGEIKIYKYKISKNLSSKLYHRMSNSVDPDELAQYDPSHLDLLCLQIHLFLFLRF